MLSIKCIRCLGKRSTIVFFFLLLSLCVFSQELTFRMDNPRLIRSNNKQLLRFDVLMKASAAGTYLYSSQVALNCTAANFVTSPSTNIEITKGFISGTYNGNQKYVINSAQWNGNKFAIQITANTANNGEDPAVACSAVLNDYQLLITIGIEISNSGGIAGITFRTGSMEAGVSGLQQFALNPLPNHGYYTSPNLFEGENFRNLYLGRIFSSSFNWSQYGGQVNDVNFLDWSVPVNTSVWDSTGKITVFGSVADNLRIHIGATLEIYPGASMSCADSTEISEAQGLWISSSPGGSGSFIDGGIITYSNSGSVTAEQYLKQNQWHAYSIPVDTTKTQPFVSIHLAMKWYDEPAHVYKWVVNPAMDSLLNREMLGYFVYSDSGITNNSTIRVSGKLNTGVIAFPMTDTPGPGGPDGWNLTGNTNALMIGDVSRVSYPTA